MRLSLLVLVFVLGFASAGYDLGSLEKALKRRLGLKAASQKAAAAHQKAAVVKQNMYKTLYKKYFVAKKKHSAAVTAAVKHSLYAYLSHSKYVAAMKKAANHRKTAVASAMKAAGHYHDMEEAKEKMEGYKNAFKVVKAINEYVLGKPYMYYRGLFLKERALYLKHARLARKHHELAKRHAAFAQKHKKLIKKHKGYALAEAEVAHKMESAMKALAKGASVAKLLSFKHAKAAKKHRAAAKKHHSAAARIRAMISKIMKSKKKKPAAKKPAAKKPAAKKPAAKKPAAKKPAAKKPAAKKPAAKKAGKKAAAKKGAKVVDDLMAVVRDAMGTSNDA